MRTLPGVAGKKAQRYSAALSERYGLTDLRLYAVLGIGLEQVVWRPLTRA